MGSSATQRHPVRSGSYELPIWLGIPGIRLAGGSHLFVMSGVMAEGDPLHLGFDTWGITKTSTALRRQTYPVVAQGRDWKWRGRYCHHGDVWVG